jgi:hypothetical protein
MSPHRPQPSQSAQQKPIVRECKNEDVTEMALMRLDEMF